MCLYVQILGIHQKEPYRKYVSSHFLTFPIELHLVRFGGGACFTFELHCSLPSTPSLFVMISLHIRKYVSLLHLA